MRLTRVEPRAGETAGMPRPASMAGVLPGYFEALGAKPILGRLVEERDLEPGARAIAVVNRPFAERFLGGGTPLGRRIAVETGSGPEAPAPEWREVVGVVEDLGLSRIDPASAAGYYVPLGAQSRFDLALRVSGDPLGYAGALRGALVSVDPTFSLQRVALLENVPNDEAFFLRLFGIGMVLLGGAALALSIVGVYAITALTVVQRTREIGVRRARGRRSGESWASSRGEPRPT